MLHISYWLKHSILLDFDPIIRIFSDMLIVRALFQHNQIFNISTRADRMETSLRAGEITCSDNNFHFSYSCSQEECKDAPFTLIGTGKA